MKIATVLLLVISVYNASGAEVPPGFQCTGYVDIDECAMGTDNCGAIECRNTIGGFECGASACAASDNGGCGNKFCSDTTTGIACSCSGYDGSPENNLLARGKIVTLSSETPCGAEYCHTGSKAVDGIYDPADTGAPETSSIVHTNNENDPWLQIDLGESRCVSAVKIWNRVPHPERLRKLLITIGETEAEVANQPTTSSAACGYTPDPVGLVQRFDCPSTMFGRYVRLSVVDDLTVLNLYEVEVIGY